MLPLLFCPHAAFFLSAVPFISALVGCLTAHASLPPSPQQPALTDRALAALLAVCHVDTLALEKCPQLTDGGLLGLPRPRACMSSHLIFWFCV